METAVFKAALHQSLQALYGQVFSGLAIDMLHFAPSRCILRTVATDTEMVLAALACINALHGRRCWVRTAASPHLPLLASVEGEGEGEEVVVSPSSLGP